MTSHSDEPVVPANRPVIAPNQRHYLSEAVSDGHLSGDGPFSRRAAAELSDIHDRSPVLLTPSCTAALELAAMLLDLSSDDEIIVPSFTFSTTASAFALRGAQLVFGEIDTTTWGLDPKQVELLITPRTRAIVTVNYGGVDADLDRLFEIAEAAGIPVIEDNAHGLGAIDRGGRPLGTRSAMSTLSFHVTKNLQCGEGGALVINDPLLRDRAEILREKGTNRQQLLRGQVDKYRWLEVGSSYLLAEVCSAMLLAQLEHRDQIQETRRTAWDRYDSGLARWRNQHDVAAFAVDPSVRERHSSHLFALSLPSEAQRDDFLDHCRSKGVGATFHYVPLHSAPAGLRYPTDGPLAVTDRVAATLARLPLFSDITPREVERTIEVVTAWSPQ